MVTEGSDPTPEPEVDVRREGDDVFVIEEGPGGPDDRRVMLFSAENAEVLRDKLSEVL